MAILWAGGRPESLTLAVGSTYTNGGGTAGRDAAYFSAANVTTHGTRESYGAFSAVSSLWFHTICFTGATASLTSGASVLSFRNSSNVAQLRLTATSNSNTNYLEIQVEKTTDGTTYTQLGSDVFRMPGQNATYDFEIVTGGSGVFRVWVNSELAFEFTGDVTTQTTISRVHMSSHHTGASAVWSENVVADTTTLGMRVVCHTVNAAGDTNTWTNTNTAIDDATYDEADFIETNTVNNVYIVNHTDLSSTLVGNRTIAGLMFNAKGTIQAASTPTDVQAAVKTGGSTFFGASQGISTSGVTTLLKEFWATNPNTSAAWTAAEITAVQLGFKAV